MTDNLELQRMRAKVEAINALPTVPSNLRKISVMLEKPRLTMDEIARFVANDPALTTKVLRMVNSAAYGFPGRISSVSHAIMLLGLNVIRGLLLGISVFDLMQKNMAGLWEHSCACAVAARCIAQQKKMKEPEENLNGGPPEEIENSRGLLVPEKKGRPERRRGRADQQA